MPSYYCADEYDWQSLTFNNLKKAIKVAKRRNRIFGDHIFIYQDYVHIVTVRRDAFMKQWVDVATFEAGKLI